MRFWRTVLGIGKELVRRATEHCVLQRKRNFLVKQFHSQAISRLHVALDLEQPHFLQPEIDVSGHYGCMLCQRRCRNAAGEAAHMNRVHGQVSHLRSLFDQPSCGACLKQYHTLAKLKAHLYYSTRCRDYLRSSNIHCQPMPGAGSVSDRARVRHHDGYLPPLVGQGPRLPDPRPRQSVQFDSDVYEFLVTALETFENLEQFHHHLCAGLIAFPISWSMLRRTLLFFLDTIDAEDADFFEFDLTALRKIVQELCDPHAWPFLSDVSTRAVSAPNLADLERHCDVLVQCVLDSPPPRIPRTFGAHRVLLHAFSGRRRIGDLQFFLERFVVPDGFILHI
eukprot:s4527_g4.t1